MAPCLRLHPRTALLAALALGACSKPPEDRAAPGFYERLALVPDAGHPPHSETTEVARFDVGEGSDEWEVRAPDHQEVAISVVPDEPKHPALRLGGEGRKSVQIAGDFDPAKFNQVALSLVLRRGKEDVQVRLWREGKIVLNSATQRFEGDGGASIVLFDLMQTQRTDEHFDGISIEFLGLMEPVHLISVSLLHRPVESWLPSVEGGSELVVIGAEGRRAVCLSTERPLECELTPPPGSKLSIAFGSPEDVRRPKDRPRLSVTLTPSSGGEAIERTFPLEDSIDRPSRWYEASFRLDAFEGQPVKARFELDVGHPEVAVCALAEPILARPGPDPPTVVLVISDTHRSDHLGASGSKVGVATPFLDSLAARGVFFENCISPTNITNPSHVSLMTALHPRDTGVVNNISPLSASASTLAERFREAGFATYASVSTTHLGDHQSGLGQGFDRMAIPFDPAQRDSQRDSTETIAVLDPWIDQAAGYPLFVWLHVFDAHSPYDPPARFARLYYDPNKDPYDPELPLLPENERPRWDENVKDSEYVVALYGAEVTYLDEQLGAFLARPRFQDAILAVTADHGESLGAHGVYYEHRELYPDTLSIPLIFAWPGAPAGTRVGRPVSHMDVGRTLLDLAGLAGTEFPGNNLVDVAGEAPEQARFVLSAHASSAGIFLGDWFLVLHLRPHRGDLNREPWQPHQVELYDLASDPTCTANLVDERHEIVVRLRKALVEWLLAAEPQGLNMTSGVHDKAALDQLAALGYSTAVRDTTANEWFERGCECEWCQLYGE